MRYVKDLQALLRLVSAVIVIWLSPWSIMVSWLVVILLLIEMLCFSPVVMPGRLINLLLVDYCRVMLILWLVICQLLLVMKFGLHTLQWNCCVYVNTFGNLVTVVTITCLF